MTHAEAVKFLMDRVKASDFHGNFGLFQYPETQRVFHTNKVHILICKQCKYRIEHDWHGGVSCGYRKEEHG